MKYLQDKLTATPAPITPLSRVMGAFRRPKFIPLISLLSTERTVNHCHPADLYLDILQFKRESIISAVYRRSFPNIAGKWAEYLLAWFLIFTWELVRRSPVAQKGSDRLINVLFLLGCSPRCAIKSHSEWTFIKVHTKGEVFPSELSENVD